LRELNCGMCRNRRLPRRPSEPRWGIPQALLAVSSVRAGYLPHRVVLLAVKRAAAERSARQEAWLKQAPARLEAGWVRAMCLHHLLPLLSRAQQAIPGRERLVAQGSAVALGPAESLVPEVALGPAESPLRALRPLEVALGPAGSRVAPESPDRRCGPSWRFSESMVGSRNPSLGRPLPSNRRDGSRVTVMCGGPARQD
jgi:hypothetical protein